MKSLKRFFDKIARYPKFKSIRQYRSFTYPQSGFKILSKKLKLSKIGEVKTIFHREIVGKVKSCTIKVNASNQWFCCIVVEQTEEEFCQKSKADMVAVGIDVGIKTFASLSDGTVIENPRFLSKSLKQLKRVQRRLSRKKKGSKNRNKQRNKVAKIHQRIKNQRRDFHFQIANRLVNTYDVIAIEKLSPKFMIQNRKLARHASDLGLSQFFEILEYESAKFNTIVGKVDPKNTSQLCSQCKRIVSKDLSVRTHECPYCGFTCDRDINAANNIVDRVPSEIVQNHKILRYGTVGTIGTLTPMETNASGSVA